MRSVGSISIDLDSSLELLSWGVGSCSSKRKGGSMMSFAERCGVKNSDLND